MFSMTAFSQAQATFSSLQLSLELKSYNNRYLEFSCGLPSVLAHMEQWTREQVAQKFARGKILLSIKLSSAQNGNPIINTQKLQEFTHLQQQLAFHGILPNYTFSDLQHYGIFQNTEADSLPDSVYQQLFIQALERLQQARAEEGRHLAEDLNKQVQILSDLTTQIQSMERTVDQHTRDTLSRQFEEMLLHPTSQQRIMEEIAAYLIKTNIHEELIRLQAHIGSLQLLFTSKEPIGRKIDFFCQELQREATTMGNKTPHVTIQQISVEMKNVVEKIREQGRNVE